MRGTLIGWRIVLRTARIIPAYAGNTFFLRVMSASVRDHPRICGEHQTPSEALVLLAGSSPHMRGTHLCAGRGDVDTGIIPAYAGNTIPCLRGIRLTGDHPRICGEHRRSQPLASMIMGSSPHMRGTLRIVAGSRMHLGIIPAYAGNTDTLSGIAVRTGDHPRICGEHFNGDGVKPGGLGSSPHMRGTPLKIVRLPTAAGIIPAYAGNTYGLCA